ncbi:hypothetical protein OG890_39615 [Streptomyces anulatus]|uniref:glycine-rich domain-containing protein n=1 Tax=Streptomyces anulatus TaxID=1892 RepID=UPI002259FDEE|nr:hypothetical protein [Streptomyces anulatus]MCX4489997.1 hypothetical protein [Streptomyces anulatus]
MQTFKNAGDHSFTVPEHVSQIRIEAVGGGGGGAGGGGHNNGSLTGGGGGGGGGASAASCTLTVTPGQTLHLNVGEGGVGGKAAETNTGWLGKNGTATTISVDGSKPVSADYGDRGHGGDGSNSTGSGYGGSGGKGGNPKNGLCEGADSSLLAGENGKGGDDGSRNSRGSGGMGGDSALYPETCRGAGVGGSGGTGAGVSGPHDQRELATPGTNGNDGCVVLTYTADAPTS